MEIVVNSNFGLVLGLVTSLLLFRSVVHSKIRKSPSQNKPGKVILLGAGPGAMDLITVRGLNALKTADIVLSDRLVDPAQLVENCKPGCRIQNVGKDSSKERFAQSDLENELLIAAYAVGEHGTVVRFKGGDPFVFGLGGSEIEMLMRNKIAYEYIPGLSSALTLPGMCVNAPLTHKGWSNGFVVLSGHALEEEWDYLPRVEEPKITLVVLMCAKRLPEIAQFLMEKKSWSPQFPCALVHNGTTSGEEVVWGTLSTIGQSILAGKAPLTLVVGKTCALFSAQQVPPQVLNPDSGMHSWSAHRTPLKPIEEDEFWVFGYGSLVWRPDVDLPFDFVEDGYVEGFQRLFFQTSPDHRGTEQSPGRVVTLVHSASKTDVVFGRAYRVQKGAKEKTLARLRHREKAGYEEVQVMVHLRNQSKVKATVFLAPQHNAHYQEATVSTIASQIYRSVGPSGTNLEYFHQLYCALSDMQLRWHDSTFAIVDGHLVELKREIDRL